MSKFEPKDRNPNPGSEEAIAQGCLCPVLDNAHGAGCGWGPGKFWINSECPIHCKRSVESEP